MPTALNRGPPPVRFATRYRLIGSAELAACVRVMEIANDGSRDINPVGELMFRALPFLFGASPSGRQIRRQNIGSCPQAESSAKSVGIFARTTPPRQCVELLDITSSDHRVIRLQGRHEALDDVGHMTPPLLFTVALYAGTSDVILVGAFLVRQMAELHRLYHAVGDKGGAQACSQAQKQHLATFVASQGLHGGVVDHFDWTTERLREIKREPAPS